MSRLPWSNSEILSDDELFGRQSEISHLTKLLETTSQDSAPNILMTGVKGSGKTVILNKLKENFEDDYLVVSMDLTFSEAYQKNNMSADAISEFFKQKVMDAAKLKNLNTDNLKECGYSLPQEIYNQNKDSICGVIVIVDEFQLLKDLGNYLDSFLWDFGEEVISQMNAAYILSASLSFNDSLISKIRGFDGAFGGRIISLNINPFSYESAEKYLEEALPELKLTDDAFDEFYSLTSGIPYYINIFARQLPVNQILTADDISDAFENNLYIIANYWINKWYVLTIREKEIMLALLNQPLKRIEIANKLNVKSGSLSLKLNKLINIDFISIINGKYMISQNLVKKWLEVEHKKRGIYPYRP